jgi:hypothetical protein
MAGGSGFKEGGGAVYARGACGTDAPAAVMEASFASGAYQQGSAADTRAAASHACALAWVCQGANWLC